MGQHLFVARIAVIVASAALCFASSQAGAQPGVPGLAKTVHTAEEITIPVVAVIAVVVVYAVVHSKHTIEGCSVAGAGGMTLRESGGQQIWELAGDTASIKRGERIRLSGRRGKKPNSGDREFTVNRLVKDKGPCS